MEPLLSLLVVNIDHVMQKVHVDEAFLYKETTLLRPVIRIFGSIDNGQRACLHIHGVSSQLYR